MRLFILFALIFAFLLASSVYANDFMLKSSAFTDHTYIPRLYSCDGRNLSPPLHWSNPPKDTKAFALIIYSPDPGIGGVLYNWIIYNIPASITSINAGAENLNEDASVGKNSFGEDKYMGPCPPDEVTHHYVFILYALDDKLDLLGQAEVNEVVDAIKHHVLKSTQLTGLFKH